MGNFQFTSVFPALFSAVTNFETIIPTTYLPSITGVFPSLGWKGSHPLQKKEILLSMLNFLTANACEVDLFDILPHGKILHQPKLKAFADDKIKFDVNENLKFVVGRLG